MSQSIHRIRATICGFVVILGIAASPLPSHADPEGDSPPEYIFPGYTEIDSKALIAACKNASEAKVESIVTSERMDGMYSRVICLQKAITTAWDDFFDDDYRKEKQLDQKLDQLIKLYAFMTDAIPNANAGCKPSCGTMWHGTGAAEAVDMLENMLESMEAQQKDYPPMMRNPEFIQWIKDGAPPWSSKQ